MPLTALCINIIHIFIRTCTYKCATTHVLKADFLQAVFVISLMIISIYIGVLGCMSVLSVNFDFVSMICLVMSAGFSVDFSVHITQHCIRSRARGGATAKEH